MDLNFDNKNQLYLDFYCENLYDYQGGFDKHIYLFICNSSTYLCDFYIIYFIQVQHELPHLLIMIKLPQITI